VVAEIVYEGPVDVSTGRGVGGVGGPLIRLLWDIIFKLARRKILTLRSVDLSSSTCCSSSIKEGGSSTDTLGPAPVIESYPNVMSFTKEGQLHVWKKALLY